MIQDRLFQKYGVSLLYKGLPHHQVKIDETALIKQIRETRSLFARYYTDSELITPPHYNNGSTDSEQHDKNGWWHCVKTDPIYLDKISSKQRYRINKGLKLNIISRASVTELNAIFSDIIDLLIDSFSDYPSIYKPTFNIEHYAKDLIDSCCNENCQIWLVKDKDSGKLVGMSYCVRDEDVINLQVIKVRPSYLKNEVNAALGYEICQYYMNELGLRYICDGERNIRHITNYQDFLIRVLGFKKAYCKLHVVYHPIVKPIINILYPLRKLISRFGKLNRHLYDVSCVLCQEEIARNFRI